MQATKLMQKLTARIAHYSTRVHLNLLGVASSLEEASNESMPRVSSDSSRQPTRRTQHESSLFSSQPSLDETTLKKAMLRKLGRGVTPNMMQMKARRRRSEGTDKWRMQQQTVTLDNIHRLYKLNKVTAAKW